VRTRRLEIRALEEPLILHLDGELREPRVHECTVTVVRGCLSVLVAQ